MLAVVDIGGLLAVEDHGQPGALGSDLVGIPLAARFRHRIDLRHVDDRAGAVFRIGDRKSTRLNSSHVEISYAVFCLKKKKYRYSYILVTQYSHISFAHPSSPKRLFTTVSLYQICLPNFSLLITSTLYILPPVSYLTL